VLQRDNMNYTEIKTLGELLKSDYKSRGIKEELRDNLRKRLLNKEALFDDVIGYGETVIPDVERALLSRHNMLFLGLRGQAKTRMARLMVGLLDEWIPIIEGNELNDDPMNPITKIGQITVEELGDKTPVSWLHRDERYVEKLATPDVSVADLIGDVDPIKAASLKLPYSDPRVLHYGLIPRSHRCIFVINELPDLQARIQVALFNILQEGDIQIRGFKMALPLEIQFVFTANPEDYTNRGSIITPLKDRIESQILTHYPESIEDARAITDQEAKASEFQKKNILIPEELRNLLELVTMMARDSDYVDEKSGVSARLSISAMENLYSTVERRMLINGEDKGRARITDLWGIIPAITGKVELVYEGEQEGPYNVALSFIGSAIKTSFLERFIDPNKLSKNRENDPYGTVRAFFAGGNEIELLNDADEKSFTKALDSVAGLSQLVQDASETDSGKQFYKELMLYGLSELDVLTKDFLGVGASFSDPLADMWDDLGDE